MISSLIRDEVLELANTDLFDEVEEAENKDKANIKLICDRYDDVVKFLSGTR